MLCTPRPSVWCGSLDPERILRAKMGSLRNVDIPQDVENTMDILRRTEKKKHEVKNRKLQYLGRVMRGQRHEILQLIIQEKIVGKRSGGRRGISWLGNLWG